MADVPPVAAAPSAEPGSPPEGIGPDKNIPQFGTPGTTIDETKLSEAFGNHKPSYPWMARLRRQQGTVVIRAYISKDGSVSQTAIEQSSGSSLIDKEALQSYSRWKYQPGPTGWVLKPFKFSLKN
jgi:protein TonB